MTFNEAVNELAGLLSDTGFTGIQDATLGAVVDGKNQIAVKGVPDDVWVTIAGRGATRVRRGNANISNRYGAHVKVGYGPGEKSLSLLRPDYGINSGVPSSSGTGNTSGVSPHGDQHKFAIRWRSEPSVIDVNDPMFIKDRQLSDLLIVPYSGMIARVLPGVATVNGSTVVYPGGTLADATAEIPAVAGEEVVGRVEIDNAGAVTVTWGSDFAGPVTDASAIGNAGAATAGRNTLGYIWLHSSTTAIWWQHILPASITSRTGGSGTDNDAIHDNVAGEIAALTEKTVLANDDVLIIEDSAASNAKKKVKISNLPAGTVDAGNVTYTPADNTDWEPDADPGDVDQALDQLASRVTTAEANIASAGYTEGARVYHNTTQTITDNSPTKVAFNSERYDTDTIHDNSTNNTRLTCTTAGVYMIGASGRINASIDLQIRILLNNTTIIDLDEKEAPTTFGTTGFSISTVYSLSATDYVELVLFHNSGADRTLNSEANFSPEFYMQRIG